RQGELLQYGSAVAQGVRKKLFRAPKCGDWLVGLHAFITSLIHETAGKGIAAIIFAERALQTQRSDESLADAMKFGRVAPCPEQAKSFTWNNTRKAAAWNSRVSFWRERSNKWWTDE